MNRVMLVEDLIAQLQKCDPKQPAIAVVKHDDGKAYIGNFISAEYDDCGECVYVTIKDIQEVSLENPSMEFDIPDYGRVDEHNAAFTMHNTALYMDVDNAGKPIQCKLSDIPVGGTAFAKFQVSGVKSLKEITRLK